jgi:hypothetical protein
LPTAYANLALMIKTVVRRKGDLRKYSFGRGLALSCSSGTKCLMTRVAWSTVEVRSIPDIREGPSHVVDPRSADDRLWDEAVIKQINAKQRKPPFWGLPI